MCGRAVGYGVNSSDGFAAIKCWLGHYWYSLFGLCFYSYKKWFIWFVDDVCCNCPMNSNCNTGWIVWHKFDSQTFFLVSHFAARRPVALFVSMASAWLTVYHVSTSGVLQLVMEVYHISTSGVLQLVMEEISAVLVITQVVYRPPPTPSLCGGQIFLWWWLQWSTSGCYRLYCTTACCTFSTLFLISVWPSPPPPLMPLRQGSVQINCVCEMKSPHKFTADICAVIDIIHTWCTDYLCVVNWVHNTSLLTVLNGFCRTFWQCWRMHCFCELVACLKYSCSGNVPFHISEVIE